MPNDTRPALEDMFLNQVVENFVVDEEGGREFCTIVLASGVFIRFELNEHAAIGVPNLSEEPAPLVN